MKLSFSIFIVACWFTLGFAIGHYYDGHATHYLGAELTPNFTLADWCGDMSLAQYPTENGYLYYCTNDYGE